jgi:hypothetical protein
MLTRSYAAAGQFQRKFSDIHSIQELKALLKHSKLGLSIRISSPTVWILDWDVSNDTVSGTLELRLEPTLRIGDKLLQMHERSFRIQGPGDDTLADMENSLLDFIRHSINTI